MQIIPAIDIKNGKCVRLTQGNFAREKIYSDYPIAVAKSWEKQGATIIHVVDLDGAKNGEMKNFEIIKKIVETITIPVQVGGGIRNKKTVEKLLNAGAALVIIGTMAIDDKEELKKILRYFPTQIAIALDAKNGKLMQDGWIKKSKSDAIKTAIQLEKLGVKKFIYTDVTKDGTLTEPNYNEIKNIMKNINASITISGGISTISQIKKLKTLGVNDIIIGKALYENRINLKEAIKC